MIQKIVFTKYLKLFCLLIVLSASSCKIESLFPQITEEEAKEVKNICSNLKVPSSFVKVKARDTIKSNLASRDIDYRSTDPPEDIEKYFINQLTAAGWKSERERQGISIRLLFKKDKYAILMEIQSSGFLASSNKLHSIGCSIGMW